MGQRTPEENIAYAKEKLPAARAELDRLLALEADGHDVYMGVAIAQLTLETYTLAASGVKSSDADKQRIHDFIMKAVEQAYEWRNRTATSNGLG